LIVNPGRRFLDLIPPSGLRIFLSFKEETWFRPWRWLDSWDFFAPPVLGASMALAIDWAARRRYISGMKTQEYPPSEAEICRAAEKGNSYHESLS